jgi:hypothetical protein
LQVEVILSTIDASCSLVDHWCWASVIR